ncbi:uncharacterized protein TM35_000321590 [Trypanosoma theileri]|uniref:Uncharacterized protein n=1 Tax=Trypanosoma theileri TaxID=67003 RepID=A0A1X0NM79_9TRYP|nr:uncharacterized protein TM35_000321590 [Trypanosoma theileri]ORC85844.1 hypothetical protein TM35_000321590 [Trypanosoma theileri]
MAQRDSQGLKISWRLGKCMCLSKRLLFPHPFPTLLCTLKNFSPHHFSIYRIFLLTHRRKCSQMKIFFYLPRVFFSTSRATKKNLRIKFSLLKSRAIKFIP